MALFSNRASSASLNRAIGALIIINSTRLTEEINSPHCNSCCIPPECESAIDAINSLDPKGSEKTAANVGNMRKSTVTVPCL